MSEIKEDLFELAVLVREIQGRINNWVNNISDMELNRRMIVLMEKLDKNRINDRSTNGTLATVEKIEDELIDAPYELVLAGKVSPELAKIFNKSIESGGHFNIMGCWISCRSGGKNPTYTLQINKVDIPKE